MSLYKIEPRLLTCESSGFNRSSTPGRRPLRAFSPRDKNRLLTDAFPLLSLSESYQQLPRAPAVLYSSRFEKTSRPQTPAASLLRITVDPSGLSAVRLPTEADYSF
ncbi:unnamed protein product [Ectocarpus fasciculatus]